MSRTPRLTDALIRASLTPAQDVTAPNGLIDAIEAGIRRAPQRHPGWRRRWGSDLGVTSRWTTDRRLVLALVAAGLVVGLLASVMIGARLRDEPSMVESSVTGIDSLTPESSGFTKVFIDGAGTSWATGPGHVTRFDPRTEERRTWTISDDLAFGAPIVAAARSGGVWLPFSGMIRRFDGTGFRETIPAPPTTDDLTALVEGPTGTLWAASTSGGPWRWDGSTWVAAPAGRRATGVAPFLVVGDDDVWVGDYSPSVDSNLGRLSHLVGGRWVTYDSYDAQALAGQGLTITADGATVWAASTTGLARFSGGAWRPMAGPDGAVVYDLVVDGNEDLWALVPGDSPKVARLRDGEWTTFGPESGLGGRGGLTRISATEDGVFVGTDAGLLRFADERFEPAWPDLASGPSWARTILAITDDEAWAVDDQGIWHFVAGAWVGPEAPIGSYVRYMALGPDGTLYATDDEGVAVRRRGQWTRAWAGAGAYGIAPVADGSVWVGAGSRAIVQLRESDGAWQARTLRTPAGGLFVAATTDGSVWTGGIGYGGTHGLARCDGETCLTVDPAGAGEMPDIGSMAADPTGGLGVIVAHDMEGMTAMVTVARFDGRSWSTLMAEQPTPWISGYMTFGPSGEVWLAGLPPALGLQRYDGRAWHDVAPGLATYGPVSVAPDGTVWFVGPSGIQRIRAEELPPE